MSEKLKGGLLVFIAALLVVNTALILTGGSSNEYVDPASAKPTFQRTADTKASTVNDKKETKAAADIASIDPIASTVDKPVGPTTSLAFGETSYDFGSIMQDSENKKVFTFTNTGAEPLIIENAKGSCGCTVPKYPKEPIAPGATGEIEVVYKPGKQKNKQTKNVTITANTDPAKTVLTISADVSEI